MNYLSFKDFVEKYGLKNEATSNVKIKENLKLMNITECGIYMRDNKFNTTSGIVNLHPTKGTHWVMFQIKIILIHMDAHPQLIYLIILRMVFIQNIKFRPTTVIARRIVYTHCISQLKLGSKCSTKFILPNFQT